MQRTCLTLAVLLAVVFAPRAAWGAGECKTPRSAADSVFRWQQPERMDLAKATTCLETAGRSPTAVEESAKRLKLVYDALGAFVVMDTISDDPDYVDADRHAIVVPHRDLPDVVLEKRGDRWLWTKTSLDQIDAYYEDVGALIKLAARLPPVFHRVSFLKVRLWQYLALVFLVVMGLVVRAVIAAVLAPRLRSLAEKVRATWPERFVDVLASPGATILTAVILRVGYPQLLLPVEWSKALSATVRVLITVSIVWAAYRAVDVLAARLGERAAATDSKLDDQLVPLLRKTMKVVVFVIGTLVVLQNLEFDVTTLFASVSIGGLALGLAARDTLANLFGSISIFVDSPFQIGDWIHVDGVDGTVEEVGFRSTRIRTFYNSVVVIPNAKIADTKVDNYGQREFRRCFTKVGLTYDTTPEQMQAFVEGVRAILQSNPFTRKDAYEVHMSAFGESALEVMLYFFFKCDTWTDELRERHNIFLEILRLARALGVSFAFPTQSLHIESIAAPGKERSAPPPRDALEAAVLGFGPEGRTARPSGPIITATRFAAKASDRGVARDDDG